MRHRCYGVLQWCRTSVLCTLENHLRLHSLTARRKGGPALNDPTLTGQDTRLPLSRRTDTIFALLTSTSYDFTVCMQHTTFFKSLPGILLGNESLGSARRKRRGVTSLEKAGHHGECFHVSQEERQQGAREVLQAYRVRYPGTFVVALLSFLLAHKHSLHTFVRPKILSNSSWFVGR